MGIAKNFNEMLARLVGPDGRDDVDRIEADIAADMELLNDCELKRESLKPQLHAAELDGNLDAAEKIDAELLRIGRLERGATGRLPVLAERRKAALDVRRNEAIAKAKEQNRACYLSVRAALLNLSAANAAAIALGERLRVEFGERDAANLLPRCAYVGIPLEDLAQMWTSDMDRQLGLAAVQASPQPRPIAPSAPKPRAVVTTSDANRAVSLNDPPTIAPKSKRRPLPKPAEGGVRITLLRGGVELPGGASSVAGDVLTVEAHVADMLLRSGAADRTEIANA